MSTNAPTTTTTAATPQRPDECPDIARHAGARSQGDYRRQRRFRCPSCGFWCLLAPAGEAQPDPEPTMTEAERRHDEARRLHPDCEECRRGKGYIVPGPRHSEVHRGHCSCSGCF